MRPRPRFRYIHLRRELKRVVLGLIFSASPNVRPKEIAARNLLQII